MYEGANKTHLHLLRVVQQNTSTHFQEKAPVILFLVLLALLNLSIQEAQQATNSVNQISIGAMSYNDSVLLDIQVQNLDSVLTLVKSESEPSDL
jgi:hypothetical protein